VIPVADRLVCFIVNWWTVYDWSCWYELTGILVGLLNSSKNNDLQRRKITQFSIIARINIILASPCVHCGTNTNPSGGVAGYYSAETSCHISNTGTASLQCGSSCELWLATSAWIPYHKSDIYTDVLWGHGHVLADVRAIYSEDRTIYHRSCMCFQPRKNVLVDPSWYLLLHPGSLELRRSAGK
jgi:hypothetical protein